MDKRIDVRLGNLQAGLSQSEIENSIVQRFTPDNERVLSGFAVSGLRSPLPGRAAQVVFPCSAGVGCPVCLGERVK